MSNEMLRARRSGGFYNNVLFEQRTNAIAKKQFEIFRGGLLGLPTPPKATIVPSLNQKGSEFQQKGETTKKSRLFRGKPIPGAPLNGSKPPLTEPSEVCSTVGNGNKVCGPPLPRFLGSGVAAAPEPSDDDQGGEDQRPSRGSKSPPQGVKRENFLRGVSARAGLSRGLSKFRRLMERIPRDFDDDEKN